MGLLHFTAEDIGVGPAEAGSALARLSPPGGRTATGCIPFNRGTKEVLEGALRNARYHGHGRITPDHLLVALLERHDPSLGRLLTDLDADATEVGDRVRERLAGPQPQDRPDRLVTVAATESLTRRVARLEETVARLCQDVAELTTRPAEG